MTPGAPAKPAGVGDARSQLPHKQASLCEGPPWPWGMLLAHVKNPNASSGLQLMSPQHLRSKLPHSTLLSRPHRRVREGPASLRLGVLEVGCEEEPGEEA